MKLPTSNSAARHHRGGRPTRQDISSSSILFTCSLVIALSSALVISSVQCNSLNVDNKPAQPVAAATSAPLAQPIVEPAKVEAPVAAAKTPKEAAQVDAKSAAAAEQPKVVVDAAAKSQQESEQARKGRSEAPAESTAAASKSTTDKPAASKQEPAQKSTTTSTSGKSQASGKSQLSGKSGASSSSSPSSYSGKKLPANLGTVTSTGSGGPAHYMSKHDAYSAIAEKHGALAQDAMRKSDKRQHHHTSNLQQRFGSGIQKASGLGELNPFKGDSGLARTLGASMRSIMKGKYSVPAYLASAVLGAVALMAFYESPISPLPVPALPEPPIGRFPPEMPVISPNLQVPFRTNQQQQGGNGYGYGNQQQGGYGQNGYQRSSYQPLGGQQSSQQQPQQVLFPGATAQAAQQRQGSAPGPVQQLAANLISSVGGAASKPAARSDNMDAVSSSRSFFGSSSQQHGQQHLAGTGKLGAPANQNKQAGSGLLSFLGLGSGPSAAPSSGGEGSVTAAASPSSQQQPLLNSLAGIHRASGLGAHHVGAGGGPVASAPGHEHKGQSVLSNSHLVNKMKSYFDRPVAHSSWSMDHNVPNQYDQYRRMSIIQALAKDTAFLSSFFSPSRRSSNSTSAISTSQLQQSINSVLSAATGGSSPSSSSASQQVAAARMQVDNHLPSLLSGVSAVSYQQQQQPIVNTKRASSGYGLMRAADRIGHALLDTFTSGLLHRSGGPGGDAGASSRKAAEEVQQQNALASATSLLSDIMSSYNAAQASSGAQSEQHYSQAPQQQQQDKQPEQASGRSAEQQQQQSAAAPAATQSGAEQQSAAAAPVAQQHQPIAAAVQAPKPQSQSAVASPESSSAVHQQQQPLSRKTRSVGLEYTIEPQVPQPPSRASQINNLVDYVSDSYKQNKMLVNFVMNQVGLSQALPYVDQFLGTPNEPSNQ